MTDVRTYLDGRLKQLESEIAKLRIQLAPLERELFEVKLARGAVDRQSSEPLQQQLFYHSAEGDQSSSDSAEIWRRYLEIQAAQLSSPYARLTIKQLVTKALSEQFPSGATAGQLLQLFANAWGRGDVIRTSLSPQLSRLRQDGIIDRNNKLWFLRSLGNDASDEKAATDQ